MVTQLDCASAVNNVFDLLGTAFAVDGLGVGARW